MAKKKKEVNILENFEDDDNFKKYEKLCSDFNILNCVGMNDFEIRHSNLLAWLFDPEGEHGLGSKFFNRYIENVLVECYKNKLLEEYKNELDEKYKSKLDEKQINKLLEEYKNKLFEEYKNELDKKYKNKHDEKQKNELLEEYKKGLDKKYKSKLNEEQKNKFLKEYKNKLLEEYKNELDKKYKNKLDEKQKNELLEEYNSKLDDDSGYKTKEINNWRGKYEVLREKGHIDILIVDDKKKKVCVIENKINAPEGKGQLQGYYEKICKKYPCYHKLFIYMSLKGDNASDIKYLSVTYQPIVDSLTYHIQNNDIKNKTKVLNLMQDYKNLLKRIIMQENEIENLCKKHKNVTDAIINWEFINKPDNVFRKAQADIIKNILKESKDFELYEPPRAEENSKYIHIYPKNNPNKKIVKAGEKKLDELAESIGCYYYDIVNDTNGLTILRKVKKNDTNKAVEEDKEELPIAADIIKESVTNRYISQESRKLIEDRFEKLLEKLKKILKSDSSDYKEYVKKKKNKENNKENKNG